MNIPLRTFLLQCMLIKGKINVSCTAKTQKNVHLTFSSLNTTSIPCSWQSTAKGLEINEKIQSNFATRYENLVAISQILVSKLPRCIVLSAVKQKNTSPQFLCVKKLLKMANDRRNGAVHVTSQLNYSTIMLSSEKFTARNKIILSFIYLFYQK